MACYSEKRKAIDKQKHVTGIDWTIEITYGFRLTNGGYSTDSFLLRLLLQNKLRDMNENQTKVFSFWS